jgi:hypothetical protein
MTKKKKTTKPKKKTTKKNTSPPREKAYGDPMPVRPVSDYYNTETGEIFPKVFLPQDSLWTKIKRLLGFQP